MPETQVGIFIQARGGSRRFPNKIYSTLSKKDETTVLEHIYGCLSQKVKQNSILAVLIPKGDQHLRDWCGKRGMRFFCGPELDVRERYRQAARHFGVDIVLRATGDNPCIDPDIAWETVEALEKEQADIFSYANLPLGTGAEAISAQALLQDVIWDTKGQREHVSAHIKQNPKIFKCCHPEHPIMNASLLPSFARPERNRKKQKFPLRLTLDTPEDLEVIRAVFACLGDDFRLPDILELYRRCPDLFAANQHVEQIKLRALSS